MDDLAAYAQRTARQAKEASRALTTVCGQQKIDWLHHAAEGVTGQAAAIIEANEQDVAKAPEYGLTDAMIDRLRLSEGRLASIADALRQVAALPDPVGEILDSNVRPNGLLVTRVSVPLGVVFFIYESRPNVTADAAALCVKSGNAVILRGGKEALHSNRALHRVLADSLEAVRLPRHAVQLVETTDRAAVGHFLKMGELIDVTIPRGGKSLIERVAQEATMPVIKHFDGNCHVYVDKAADLSMATQIVLNAKCQRPGVCNAAESLVVHRDIADQFVPQIGDALQAQGVEIRGDNRVCELFPAARLASEDDFRTEFLDLIISANVVETLDAAISHINNYGSGHTEAIVTQDIAAAEEFLARVDSSAVLVNASTRFNDGGEFGLGAEIGISTDRFHARGPCGLRELTSYKWVVRGKGQIRQ